jgi:hypothetical protein
VACQTAEKQVKESSAKQHVADDTVRIAADAALRYVLEQVAEVKVRLAALPDMSQVIADMHTAATSYAALISNYSALDRKLADARTEARSAIKEAKQERKRVQDLNEARRAQRLFHGMNPTICPRCSTAIGDDRIELEKDHDACSVCARGLELDNVDLILEDTDIDDDGDVEQDDQDTLDLRARQMEALAAQADQRMASLAEQLIEVQQQRDGAEAALNTLREQVANGQDRAAADLELAQLEARAEQLRELTALPVVEPTNDNVDATPPIINAARAEADQRVKDGFAAIITDLNAEILLLGQRFGIEALQSVAIDRATHLKIRKGDAHTNYSSCTPGERLRLRLAVVIAMLRVADQHHVGRHPGLLMIDSLGAEETEASNLSQFMEALAEVTTQLGIETITASARVTTSGDDPILAHIPDGHALVVTGADPLW